MTDLVAEEYERVKNWPEWELKIAYKALTSGVALFMNDDADNARIEAIKLVRRDRKNFHIIY